jgi:hypothetical protein
MNYYEELGIRPDADAEEIRKAHRRLVKLMHPDQHRDQGLKQLAETQMRRLNSIVATLLDPEEREEYDEELKGDSVGPTPRAGIWRTVPLWIASTLATIVLTVAALWFWKDRMGDSMSTRTPIVIENSETAQPSKETTTVPVPLPPVNEHGQNAYAGAQSDATTTSAPPSAPLNPKASVALGGLPAVPTPKVSVASPTKEIAPAQTQPYPAKRAESNKPGKVDTAHNAPPTQRVAPLETPKIDGKKKLGVVPLVSHVDYPKTPWESGGAPGTSAITPDGDNVDIVIDRGRIPGPGNTGKRLGHDPLEGEWVYAPTEPEKRKAGFYPPEFIKLRLVKQADGMHGEYNARYNVADSRPVAPEVSFALKSVDKDSRKYVWTAVDGRHGTFEIHLLESDTMRMEWRTTGGRSGPALTSGMATLVRKN